MLFKRRKPLVIGIHQGYKPISTVRPEKVDQKFIENADLTKEIGTGDVPSIFNTFSLEVNMHAYLPLKSVRFFFFLYIKTAGEIQCALISNLAC